MDKRKLKVGKFTRMGDTCLELETRGLCAIMGAGNQKTREEDAAELAKRWNAYPELVGFLEMIGNGGINEAGEAQIETEARNLLETLKA